YRTTAIEIVAQANALPVFISEAQSGRNLLLEHRLEFDIAQLGRQGTAAVGWIGLRHARGQQSGDDCGVPHRSSFVPRPELASWGVVSPRSRQRCDSRSPRAFGCFDSNRSNAWSMGIDTMPFFSSTHP